MSLTSKDWIAAIPDLPSIRAFQLRSIPMPSGVTSPIPVTTTRLMTVHAFCELPRPEGGAPGFGCYRNSALLMGFDEGHRVLDGDNLFGVPIGDFTAEFFFERHDQLDGIEAVGAEIVDEAGVL